MSDYTAQKKFDDLGRIVIPIDMRRYYGFVSKKQVKIVPTKDGILLITNRKEK